MSKAAVIPSLRYHNAHAAIAWLVQVFGFTAQAVYDGPDNTVAHAQLTLGRGMIMLGSASNTGGAPETMVQPDEIGGRTTGQIYLVVDDIDAVYAAAKKAGAPLTGEMRTMEYGGKGFGCVDLEGHLWSVGEYDPWAAE
jgi:uncharacterized glyoxalase superfamily protein PhnB